MSMLALIAVLQAGAVAAAPPQLPPLTGKDVAARFSSSDPQRYFPEEAHRRHVTGAAVAICTISDVGRLTDCAVESESPAGYGFGDATLKVASGFQIPNKAKDGSPTIGRKFRLSMTFALP